MDQKVKNLENEEYAAEVTEGMGCRVFVKVIVKPQSAQKAYKQAIKKVNKQVSVPGFRKGHVPERTVISRYASHIEQEWKEIIVNDAYRSSLELTNIYPLNKESIQKPKIESCSQEEGAIVHLSYEHYPHVPFVEFSQIRLPPQEKIVISEEKIGEILDEVRKAHADWENIEGRSVIQGDFVDISIDSLQEEPPKPIVKDRRFEVSEKKLTPWLAKLLIGLNIGESIEGESEVDENAEVNIKKNFKATKVRITLHAIKKIILPEINEELAKKAGASSIEDLKNKIHENLQKEAEENEKQKRITALEDILLNKYTFDLPFSTVDFEKKERVSKRFQALKNENLSAEEIKMQQEEIEREVQSEVDRDIRLYFLNKQIAKQGKIGLSNQELNDELLRHMSQNPYLYGKDQDDATTRELVSRIAASLMQKKTKEYALAQVELAQVEAA